MRSYPSLEEDLAVLLGPDHGQLLPVTAEYTPAKEFAASIQADTPDVVPLKKLSDMRLELQTRFATGRIGSLMSQRMLNREEQGRTLSSIGPDVILDMVAEGLMFPRIAKRLAVSYSVLLEYMELMVEQHEMARAESLAADMLIDNAMEELEREDMDREQISRAKAMADLAMKVAKAKSDKWTERKPVGDTYVQQNYGTASGQTQVDGAGKQVVHGFQLVLTEGGPPPLKPLAQTAVSEPKPDEHKRVINGEFELVPGERDAG